MVDEGVSQNSEDHQPQHQRGFFEIMGTAPDGGPFLYHFLANKHYLKQTKISHSGTTEPEAAEPPAKKARSEILSNLVELEEFVETPANRPAAKKIRPFIGARVYVDEFEESDGWSLFNKSKKSYSDK